MDLDRGNKSGRKANKEKKYRKPSVAAAAEDDNLSISSEKTDSTAPSEDDQPSESNYEDKLKEAMDLAQEKSVHTRTNALVALATAMRKRVLTGFLLENQHSLFDLVERSLKKGRGAEQVAAANLGAMLVVTLSAVPEVEQVFKDMSTVLTVILQDASMGAEARREACLCLALGAFLSCHDLADVTTTMMTLHGVFAASLPKGNGELPTHTLAIFGLHTAALNGYGLLLCLLSPSTVFAMADRLLREMLQLLGCSDVDVRIMAGEVVALIYEAALIHDEDFQWGREEELLVLLHELATDSHKFRGKKDRKQQRASFRDVVRTVEGVEVPTETVQIGRNLYKEPLVLDSWSAKWQYTSLCHSLGQGMPMHFSFNVGVRDVFSLGPPPPVKLDVVSTLLMVRKNARPNRETPETKARRLSRTKNRDNRAAAKSYYD